ncbi:MAG: EAL domain-containing protein [Proteobacteria bacterium]|nr:EAL domain-containing protein [Pseudomonadota bacterium]
MSRILIVGQSATLRRGIELRFEKVAHSVRSCTRYEEALSSIREDGGEQIRAVIIGHTGDDPQGWVDLKTQLDAPLFHNVAVLVVATERSRDVFEWTARRAHSSMLLWDEAEDIVDNVRHLTRDLETELFEPQTVNESINILFVDDSKTSRTRFSRLLKKNGYHVEVAENSKEGLEAAKSGKFDMAIIDYFMPDGNGDALCKTLMEMPETKDIQSAILTGSYLDELIHDSLASGAVECMFKNESEALFLARIAAMARAVESRKSINAERQRLEGILSSVGDGVYGVDNTGMITFANPAAVRILGYENDSELIGKRAHRIFHYAHRDGSDNPEETCFLQQAYEVGDELGFWETVFWNSASQPIDVECSVQPLHIDGCHEGSVVGFRDIVDRKVLERELLWQANHDSLTELHNRNYFEDELEREVAQRQRSGESSAVLFIDLDRFKQINDTAGHAAGDRLLIDISRQLRTRLRTTDMLARLGGDEFAVILRNVNESGVTAVAESFREVLEEYSFNFDGKQFQVQGSVGVCVINKKSVSASEVMSNADIACRVAKTDGRNQVHLFDPDNDKKQASVQDMGWSERLQQALELDRFVLHYQPMVPLGSKDKSSNVSRYEVLLRYLDEDDELVLPNAFLSAAERFGIVPKIDRWVVRHAIIKLSSVRNQVADWVFSINLSGPTLSDPDLVKFIGDTLRLHKVAPSALMFEISESTAVENIDAARAFITELGKLGCRFVLDDFGAGFSSFNHLKHLPVDYIKISSHIVRDIAKDSADLAIVKSINDVAHAFNKKTIATQVEDKDVVMKAKEIGVDYIQGWYISKPEAEPVKCEVLESVAGL